MKLLLLCLLIVVSVTQGEVDYIKAPPDEMARVFGISLNCIAQTGVDADALYKLIAWTVKDEDNVKRFMYCLLTKAGYANKDGLFLKQNIMPFVKNHSRKDEFMKVLDECNKLDGKDKYDRLFKRTSCNHEKSPIQFQM